MSLWCGSPYGLRCSNASHNRASSRRSRVHPGSEPQVNSHQPYPARTTAPSYWRCRLAAEWRPPGVTMTARTTLETSASEPPTFTGVEPRAVDHSRSGRSRGSQRIRRQVLEQGSSFGRYRRRKVVVVDFFQAVRRRDCEAVRAYRPTAGRPISHTRTVLRPSRAWTYGERKSPLFPARKLLPLDVDVTSGPNIGSEVMDCPA